MTTRPFADDEVKLFALELKIRGPNGATEELRMISLSISLGSREAFFQQWNRPTFPITLHTTVGDFAGEIQL